MRDINERFDDLWTPEPNTGCWLWISSTNAKGYGLFTRKRGECVRAHRFSYERERGPIPDGLEIDHLCRVTCCVNPAHLEAVTPEENRRRRPVHTFGTGNKNKTHCAQGHPYSPDNTYLVEYRTQRGRVSTRRQCRTCVLTAMSARYQRRKLAA